MEIFTVITSIGTFLMATIYFVSITIQLYQMRTAFLPALDFNQIFLVKNKNDVEVRNISEHTHLSDIAENYIMLINLGGGTAKNITIKICKGEDEEVLQTKYVNILPNNQHYLLPINERMFSTLENTITEGNFETELTVILQYNHSLTKKQKTVRFNGEISLFNKVDTQKVYELQFFESDRQFL